jgi:hypothetical protein
MNRVGRGAALGGGGMALSAMWMSAPWPVAALCTVLATVAWGISVILQNVMPQESAHRLAWWRDRRRHLRHQTETSASNDLAGLSEKRQHELTNGP